MNCPESLAILSQPVAEPSYRIWLSPPTITGDEQKYVSQALASGWLAPAGPQLEQFEAELSEHYGKPTVALQSGTAALHLALRLAGVGPGDAVLMPTLNYIAAASAATQQGAQVVLLDSEADDYHHDVQGLKAALALCEERGWKPKALVVVHLFGHSADMELTIPLARAAGLTVIEDAAEAVGVTSQGFPVGSRGDYGVLSFNGNKLITTGGGGALICPNAETAARAHYLARHARKPVRHYQHEEWGYNYRMSNLNAAVGLAQWKHLAAFVASRKAIQEHYRRRLGQLPGIQFDESRPSCQPSYWLTTFRTNPEQGGVPRDVLLDALEAQGIQARPVWKPLHLQPVLANAPFVGTGNATRHFAQGLCLPSGSSLTMNQVDEVCEVILQCFATR